MTETESRVRAVCIAAREYLAACHLSIGCRLQADAILAAHDIAFGTSIGHEEAAPWRRAGELRRIYRSLPGGSQEESERFRLAEDALIEDLEVVAVIVSRTSYLMPAFNRLERGGQLGQ